MSRQGSVIWAGANIDAKRSDRKVNYYYTWQPSTNTKIVTDLTKALNGEYHAIHCYEQLANQVPNQEVKIESLK